MQGDDCDHSANAGKPCEEATPVTETTHANHGQRHWDSIADTHKQHKEMTVTVLPTHTSNARKRLQLRYQHMTAMQGSSSGYSANNMQTTSLATGTADTRQQRREATLTVPNTCKPWEKVITTALPTQTSNANDCDCRGSACKPRHSAAGMAVPTRTQPRTPATGQPGQHTQIRDETPPRARGQPDCPRTPAVGESERDSAARTRRHPALTGRWRPRRGGEARPGKDGRQGQEKPRPARPRHPPSPGPGGDTLTCDTGLGHPLNDGLHGGAAAQRRPGAGAGVRGRRRRLATAAAP